MFTTLVAQKALAGTRKNKTALRKIDRFIIKTPVAAEKLISCGEFAREAFICGEDNTAATPVPGHCNHSLREQNGLAPAATGPPSRKADSRFGTISSLAR